MKILLKSAKVIIPESKYHGSVVDIFISKGRIAEISPKISTEADQEINLKNLHISLGWFDSSVSFGEPGYEERQTLQNGLLTSAKSGFTAIALNPTTNPVSDNNSSIAFLKNYSGRFGVDVFPVGAVTKASKGKDLAELYDMCKAGAVSFNDYKKPIHNPNLLKIALQYAQNFDALVQSFPQENRIAGNGNVHEHHQSTLLGLKGIPSLAEELQIVRDLFILEYTGGKLHIPTISTANSVKLIESAKNKGLDVTCSVAIHQLIFTDEKLKQFDTNYKVTPPLRTKTDQEALIEGLKTGVIDMVTSDHMPIDIEHKKVEFENALYGTIGLESAFGALQTVFDLEDTINHLTNGRERFGLKKPKFEEGEKANLTFFNPEEEYIFLKEHICSTSKNSIFLNSKLKGKVLGIFAHNQLKLF